jgi:hypothetical protein
MNNNIYEPKKIQNNLHGKMKMKKMQTVASPTTKF